MTTKQHHREDFNRLAERWGFPKWYGDLYHDHKVGTLDYSDYRITQNPLKVSEFWLKMQIDNFEKSSGMNPRETAKRLTSTQDQEMDIPMFIREMFQNAYDVRPRDGSRLRFEVEIDEDYSMKISHNGIQFRPPSEEQKNGELLSLFHLGATTKDSSWDSEGQFGIGFKGWVTFFQEVSVSCVSMDEEISVSWKVDSEGYHSVEIEKEDVKEIARGMRERQLTTSFTFRLLIPNKPKPSSTEILKELNSLTRFRPHPVTCRVVDHDDHKTEIIHEADVLHHDQDHRILLIRNQGGPQEHTEKMLGVELEIKESPEITTAIQSFIDEKKDLFNTHQEQDNPWEKVTVGSWYEHKRICFGVILDSPVEERLWLHRLAPINASAEYHTNSNSLNKTLHARTNWVIDAPLWLDHNRQKTSSGPREVKANAKIIQQAISSAAPLLAGYMSGEEAYKDQIHLIYSLTPFDNMLHNPSTMYSPAFVNILYRTSQYGGPSPHPRNPKSYVEIFKEGGIHCDSTGRIIDPSRIQTYKNPANNVCRALTTSTDI